MSINRVGVCYLIKHLKEGQYGTKELAQLTGLSVTTVIEYLKLFKSKSFKYIRIAGWKRYGMAWNWNPVYEWDETGCKPDVPKPPKLTQAAIQAAHRAKQKKEAGAIKSLPNSFFNAVTQGSNADETDAVSESSSSSTA